MKRFKGTKGIILLVVLVFLVLGYYFHLSNRDVAEPEETDAQIMTMTQKALGRNLETNYPPSPREVVKYFSEITQCFYNEEHDDEEIKALGLQMRGIYDDELIANQTEEEYLDLFKKDIDEYNMLVNYMKKYNIKKFPFDTQEQDIILLKEKAGN